MLRLDVSVPRTVPEMLHRGAVGLWAGVVVVALVLTVRRGSGAFVEPSGLLCSVGAATAACAALAAYALFHWGRREAIELTTRRITLGITTAPPLLVAVALLPSASALSIAALTTFTIGYVSAAWAVSRFNWQALAESQVCSRTFLLPSRDDSAAPTPQLTAMMGEEAEDAELVQQMTRRRSSDGQTEWDTIEGVICVSFLANQRQMAVHLPICPAMPRTPEVEWALTDEQNIRGELAAVHSYGVRINLRRPISSNERMDVRLNYVIACPLVESTEAAA